MTFQKLEMRDVAEAVIQTSPEWQITHHRLFLISPDEAANVETGMKGFTVWDLYFGQDLLQAVNPSKGMLLDVGWYPHADPSGSFRLQLIGSLTNSKSRSPYDWDHPVVDFLTRSLQELLDRIHGIVLS